LAEEGAVPHQLVITRQVRDWLHALRSGDPVTRRLVAEAIDRLLDDGPALGRPLADRIAGSRLHNLKELRPASSGTTEVRILFIFDPARNAVLLVRGGQVRPVGPVVPGRDPGSRGGLRGVPEGKGTAMSEEPEFFSYTREEFLDEFVHPDDRPAVEEARQRRALQVRAEYLTEMRKKVGLTQAEVAEAMGVSQQRVSAIESGAVAELATLGDYIRALGGELKVIADFGDSWRRVA
jgi:DNA-binding XRE family transcriptional regulator